MNTTVPAIVLNLLLSKIPPINSRTPKNPSITGIICENNVIPVKAIFYH